MRHFPSNARLQNAALIAIALMVARPHAAWAQESTALSVAIGARAELSSWRGDWGAGEALRLGLRFGPRWGADVQVAETYFAVDQRINSGLSLGAVAYWPATGFTPYARAFGIHQHEQPWVSVLQNPVGVVAGVGAGIRHRAGAGLSLGAEFPMQAAPGKPKPKCYAHATGTWLSNHLGPNVYVGLELGVGMDVGL